MQVSLRRLPRGRALAITLLTTLSVLVVSGVGTLLSRAGCLDPQGSNYVAYCAEGSEGKPAFLEGVVLFGPAAATMILTLLGVSRERHLRAFLVTIAMLVVGFLLPFLCWRL
jgi:hypothetical protein